MKITEPSVMITDFLLAIFMGYWSFLILNSDPSTSQLFWGISFLLSAFGAVIGGIAHGLKANFSEKSNIIIWKSTTYSVGIASSMMMNGLITYFSEGTLRILLMTLNILVLIGYLIWMAKHDEFIYVILYYGPLMLIVLVTNLVSYIIDKTDFTLNFVLGVLIAFVAAGVQASKKGLHEHFNNNDIFHIIQIVSGYFLYRGIILL